MWDLFHVDIWTIEGGNTQSCLLLSNISERLPLVLHGHSKAPKSQIFDFLHYETALMMPHGRRLDESGPQKASE